MRSPCASITSTRLPPFFFLHFNKTIHDFVFTIIALTRFITPRSVSLCFVKLIICTTVSRRTSDCQDSDLVKSLRLLRAPFRNARIHFIRMTPRRVGTVSTQTHHTRHRWCHHTFESSSFARRVTTLRGNSRCVTDIVREVRDKRFVR